MEFDITQIVLSVLGIVGSIALAFVTKYVNKKESVEKIKEVNEGLDKFNKEFYLKQTWAQEAVAYAQQKLWDEKGAKKYDAAMEVISGKAREYNIDITPKELEVLIESALFNLKSAVVEVIDKTGDKKEDPVTIEAPNDSFTIDNGTGKHNQDKFL